MMDREERRDRRRKIANAMRSGRLSVSEAALKFEVSPQMVRNACLEFDVPILRKGSRSSLVVVARLLRGKREIDIAHELKVSPQYVNRVKLRAAKAGIQFASL